MSPFHHRRQDDIDLALKIAIDSNGVIVYRDGYGKGDEWLWETVFDKLGS